MPTVITFTCQCGEVYHADESHVGRTIYCWNCARALLIRLQETVPSSPPEPLAQKVEPESVRGFEADFQAPPGLDLARAATRLRRFLRVCVALVCAAEIVLVFYALLRWLWDPQHPGPFVISLIVAYVGSLCAIRIAWKYSKNQLSRMQEWIDKNLVACPHGIRGGMEKGSCPTCAEQVETDRQRALEAEREQQRRHSIAVGEQQRRHSIAIRAKELHQRELIRLTKAKYRRTENLFALSPQEFEDAIATMFRAVGYEVHQTPYSNDGGKDAVAIMEGKRYVIECKKYRRDKSIGRPMIQRFCAAMRDERAISGFFVATCDFAAPAIEYAKKNSVTLMGCEELTQLAQRAFPEDLEAEVAHVLCLECGEGVHFRLATREEQKACSNGHTVVNTLFGSTFALDLLNENPRCVRCGLPMRLVDGRRGKFWGCSQHPRCRSTQEYLGVGASKPRRRFRGSR